MNDKDIVSKDILKRLAVDIARLLLNLQVDRAEIIETEFQCIEDRRADLVAQMWGGDGEFILHVEIQNSNDAQMPWRMLRYRSEIGRHHPAQDVRQYLIYIGKAGLTMAADIEQTGLSYRYRIIDMHSVDCETLLTHDDPDALVLAILCDFKGRPEREVVHYILERLQYLTGDNLSRFREYLRMLEILSTNRNLEQAIEEEEKMLSQVKYSQLPSYKIGMQQGIQDGLQQGMKEGMDQGMKQGVEQGVKQGEAILLERLLKRCFGALDEQTLERLKNAAPESLEQWAENILDAVTLDDVFKSK